MGIRVGIDLGTTFSSVAYIREETGKPEVLKNVFGSPLTPSVLSFLDNGDILYGEDAKNIQSTGDNRTIAFFKRYMGNEDFKVVINKKIYNATDLSAILLNKLKIEAEKTLGKKIDSAVITVPAYFKNKEREETMEAGRRAGLNVTAILNEPTAAAYAYGLNEKDEEQTVIIYDLGGGTFDVTVARVNKNKIEILGTDGNNQLGGKDWDDCIARYLMDQFLQQYQLDISDDIEKSASMTVLAENIKKQLSVKEELNVPIFYKGISGSVLITQSIFDDISQYLIGETKEKTESLIEELKLDWNMISGVILVGGSTRMKMIHNYIKEMSGKDPIYGVNVDEAVALGAAIKANIDEKGKSISNISDIFNIGKKQIEIRGAKSVSDVTSHALGMVAISKDGNRFINQVIIGKNDKIPATGVKTFSFRVTPKNDILEVYVTQGAYERPSDNAIIKKYSIRGMRRENKGLALIDVEFCYNTNCVVEVSARQREPKINLSVTADKIPVDLNWMDGSPEDLPKIKPTSSVVLAIDLSGSMSGTSTQMAQKAMLEFVVNMDPNYTKIGVCAFGDEVKQVCSLTNNMKSVQASVDNLTTVDVGMGTSAEPFTLAQQILNQDQADTKYIVVLTDGEWSNKDNGITIAHECRKKNIHIIALGFGTADRSFLESIASEKDLASMTNISELSESFSRIAQVISNDSTSIRSSED